MSKLSFEEACDDLNGEVKEFTDREGNKKKACILKDQETAVTKSGDVLPVSLKD